MRYCERRPSADLAPYLHCIWELEGDASALAEPIFPDGRIEVVVHLADRPRRRGDAHLQPRAMIVGQMLEATHLDPVARLHAVGVRFTPGGARAWVARPLHEITGRIEDAGTVCGHAASRLQSAIEQAETADERFAAVESATWGVSHSFKTHPASRRQTDHMHTLLMLVTLAQAADASVLSWMAGCWRQESSGRLVEEMWMPPSGDGMLGMSRTVAKGQIVDYEFLQIRVQDGRLVYIAKPARQPEATFTATTASAREVIFENLAHDFPQRVIYRLQPDGNLAARIEGAEKGKARAVDFPMRRAACP